jgi:AcrR family transcriptional regulator
MSAKLARAPIESIGLAGGALRQRRHVCGLFEGPEDSYRTLLPFIAEGLQRGERALHIVDPALRDFHLERLASAGIDVQGSLDSGQLEVTTWDSAYLRTGRFDGGDMVTLIRESLEAAREMGYPITRAIGYMEWVDADVRVTDLLAYETEIDATLQELPDPVVCAYDVERHTAGRLVRILGAHPVGIIGGALKGTGGADVQPRDRILKAASDLFSRRGIRATGVDGLIKKAGVAKATFYRHFPSKDDLIVAWLLDERTRWFDRVRRIAEETANSPDELVPALFDAVAAWLEADDYRGCPYLNTAAEIVNPAHPARQALQDYLSEIEAYLERALAARGYVHAAALAAEIQTLLAGGTSLSAANGTSAPVMIARNAAIRLLRDSEAEGDWRPTGAS